MTTEQPEHELHAPASRYSKDPTAFGSGTSRSATFSSSPGSTRTTSSTSPIASPRISRTTTSNARRLPFASRTIMGWRRSSPFSSGLSRRAIAWLGGSIAISGTTFERYASGPDREADSPHDSPLRSAPFAQSLTRSSASRWTTRKENAKSKTGLATSGDASPVTS